jgi:hypothetical protein
MLVDFRALERIAHAANTGLLLPLDPDVVAVGYAKGLFPRPPRRIRNAAASRPFCGKSIALLDIGERPVEIVRDFVPIVAAQQSHRIRPRLRPAEDALEHSAGASSSRWLTHVSRDHCTTVPKDENIRILGG